MTNAQLQRIIGVRALALGMVNVTVGAGIFGLPAYAAHDLGAGAVFAYLACMVLAALVGLCLAEAGSRVSRAGGLYAYAAESHGPFVGAVTGQMLWFANGAVSNAAVATLFADTLGLVAPALAAPVARVAMLLAYYAVLVLINVRGARYGVRFSQLTTVIKLTPLVALVVLGMSHVHAANLHIAGLPTAGALGRTSVLLFFAFLGFESGLSTSGEVEAPARTVPRALLLALTLIATLYLGLQLVAQGVLGPALATAGDAPLGATALAAFGPIGGTGIVVATLLSTSGTLASDTLNTPRVIHALGRDGMLPRALGLVHARYRTPSVAIVAYAVVCAALALSGTFRALATLAASGTLCLYLVCCTGVLRLRRRGVQGDKPPFVVPGGPVVPVLATAAILAMLAGLQGRDFLALGALLGVAAGMAAWSRRSLSREARRGVPPT
jgi:basic amino acid/polyamine antiporter, APA family